MGMLFPDDVELLGLGDPYDVDVAAAGDAMLGFGDPAYVLYGMGARKRVAGRSSTKRAVARTGRVGTSARAARSLRGTKRQPLDLGSLAGRIPRLKKGARMRVPGMRSHRRAGFISKRGLKILRRSKSIKKQVMRAAKQLGLRVSSHARRRPSHACK